MGLGKLGFRAFRAYLGSLGYRGGVRPGFELGVMLMALRARPGCKQLLVKFHDFSKSMHALWTLAGVCMVFLGLG